MRGVLAGGSIRLAVVGAFAALAASILSPAGAQAQETREGIERLFREGVDLFEMNRLEEARERFHQVLTLDPTAAEAWKLAQQAGDRIMAQLMTTPQLGREVQVIYDLYRLHASRLKRDPENIRALVTKATDPQAHPVERWKAIHELQQVDQFAIPFLVDALGDTRNHEIRSLARVTATKMGAGAVLPLMELLKLQDTSDAIASRERHIRESAALILGDIEPSDERAIAALKRVAEQDSSPVVRKYALRSIQKITGLNPEQINSSENYYYSKADRYVREMPGVAAEASRADGVIWRLEDGALVDYQVPRYAWNEMMAEQACYECIEANPDYEGIYVLLAQVVASQISESTALLDIASERASGRPFSEEEIAEVRGRDRRLYGPNLELIAVGPARVSSPDIANPQTRIRRNLIIASLGPKVLYKAIGKSLSDARTDDRLLPKLAVGVLADAVSSLDVKGDLLPGVARGRKDEQTVGEGQSLVNALRFEGGDSDQIRFSAAIALARMSPPRPFDGAQEVVSTLARAISQTGPLQVLVVEADARLRNEVAGKLRDIGASVSFAEDARQAAARAAGFPPFDVLVVSPRLAAPNNTQWLLERLASEPATRAVPVAIVTTHAQRDQTREQFESFASVKGYLPVEDSGRDLKAMIDSVVGEGGSRIMTKRRTEAMALAAAEALLAIDPHLAEINGMKVADAAEALVGSLANRPDELRKAAIDALGLFSLAQGHDRLIAIAVDASEDISVRAAAIRAIGRITPEKSLDQLVSLASREDSYLLRYLAAQSFGDASPPPLKLKEFLMEIRPAMSEGRAMSR